MTSSTSKNSSSGSTKSNTTLPTSLYLSMASRSSSVASSGRSRLYPPQDEQSFDLLPPGGTPVGDPHTPFSLEDRAEKVLGAEHLSIIFSHPTLLSNFADFLTKRRTDGLRMLVYYLDVQKALRAIAYANAITSELENVGGRIFTEKLPEPTQNRQLQEMADTAFKCLIEELCAYVTQIYIDVVSHNMRNKITGDLRVELKESVDGLGESFCLTDPSRADNPIVFMSEEFNRVTQYGVSYVIGKNCRFLQGPRTSKSATERLKEAITQGREISEVFMNYKRDGSPFLNLLMVAPLRDSQGAIRYFLGAQVDVSQLVKDGIGLEAMNEYDRVQNGANVASDGTEYPESDEFRELADLFNDAEIETAAKYGGRLHKGRKATGQIVSPGVDRQNTRIVVQSSPEYEKPPFLEPSTALNSPGGLFSGVYQHYILVRPFPSLRILFTSPSLRTPGIHQLHFMSKIGGSPRVKDELHAALRAGRGVTAKVYWITNRETNDGRDRWVHCTPLRDANGDVGVWMIVVVDQSGQPARPASTRSSRRRRRSAEKALLAPRDEPHVVRTPSKPTRQPPAPPSPPPSLPSEEQEELPEFDDDLLTDDQAAPSPVVLMSRRNYDSDDDSQTPSQTAPPLDPAKACRWRNRPHLISRHGLKKRPTTG